MTAYQQKSFTVRLGNPAFSSGWDRIFAKKEEEKPADIESVLADAEKIYGNVAMQEAARDRCVGECHVCDELQKATAKVDFEYPLKEVPISSLPLTDEEIAYGKKVAQRIEQERISRDVSADFVSVLDRESLSLPEVQRRMREWADYNFPLKVTDEHKRIADEFIANVFDLEDQDLADGAYRRERTDLAYLLASRESRNHRPLIGACEEIGELCHAHLKNEQGVRGTPEEHRLAKQDAIGDTLIYLLDYCNKEGFCMEECLEMAIAETSSRDWIRFPKNGKTE